MLIITNIIIGNDTIAIISKLIIACFKVISFFLANKYKTGIKNNGKKKYDVPYEYAVIPAIIYPEYLTYFAFILQSFYYQKHWQ